MSDAEQEAAGVGGHRRRHHAPYTPHNPVPSKQNYEARQQERQNDAVAVEPEDDGGQKGASAQDVKDAVKSFLHVGSKKGETPQQRGEVDPYPSENRNVQQSGDVHQENEQDEQSEMGEEDQDDRKTDGSKNKAESLVIEADPRKRRKQMKKMKRDAAGREVTDPVTHLPVVIHDSTDKELKKAPENFPPPFSQAKTSPSSQKRLDNIEEEVEEEQAAHDSIGNRFPPPEWTIARQEMARVHRIAIASAIGALSLVVLVVILASPLLLTKRQEGSSWWKLIAPFSIVLALAIAVGGSLVSVIQFWLGKKVNEILEDDIWRTEQKADKSDKDAPIAESAQWLNSLLAAIWPLVNPDLFTSLADDLEDVMQASLPKAVRMVSVDDLGQGTESIQILGVKWLPTGAAAKNVSTEGKLKDAGNEANDRKVSGEGDMNRRAGEGDAEEQENDGNHKPSSEDQKETSEEENIAEGMEAEQGDFVNMEVGFSYRASSKSKGIGHKARSAHLFLKFYLVAGVEFPVWVELRGLVGTLRLRLQLCPDPPFFSLCTLTLLGQPKAEVACVPLVKKGLNIMDLPLISSFVQTSLDAALSEYVAPRSLVLDIKGMIVGADFKKDTSSKGVLVVHIKRAMDFKQGDVNLGNLKRGSCDPYVTVGWAKFGKPVFSTRVLVGEMEPVWEETAFVLVGAEELNAEERLRVQLWDSDRFTADDDLGRIEVDLKELMHSKSSKGRMWDRKDRLNALDADNRMPGTLEWSVGYYSKTRIQGDQLAKQTEEKDIKNVDQLKEQAAESAKWKLREASDSDQSGEIEKQTAQDLKDREDTLIISSPPPEEYPTGILSIQIHQITGLEYERHRKSRDRGSEEADDEAGSGDLPSSYCTVILNHQKIFKTRTKPKNDKPFFNAGTERVIRDWRNTEIFIAVQDARVHENDPLIGIVYLPLARIFSKRSQIMDTYPLMGGIGYGRVRVSMVFRSVHFQAPKPLLGWEYGTLEVTGAVKTHDLPQELRGLRLKLRTAVNHGKMYPDQDGDSENTEGGNDGSTIWKAKKDRPVRLAVRKRFSSAFVIEFRRNMSMTKDKTAAFAVFWLKDLPDEEEQTLSLKVWDGDGDLKRAQVNCLEDMGTCIGKVEVPVRFFRGLGAYHKRLAKNNQNLRDVLDVIDTASDNHEIQEAFDLDEDSDGEGSSSSSNDDGEDGDGVDGDHDEHPLSLHKTKKNLKAITGLNTDDKDYQTDGSRNPMEKVRDYLDNRNELHREHRGMMQWKGPRTAHWLKSKVEHGKEHIKSSLSHHERESGVETET